MNLKTPVPLPGASTEETVSRIAECIGELKTELDATLTFIENSITTIKRKLDSLEEVQL